LISIGIAQRAARLKAAAAPTQSAEIDGALRRLTHPEQMGDLFKALAICQVGMGPPPGFAS
jgi:NADH dehydrogenase [ubiquinone] 1 alpha subcomplex assembly factor 7